MKKYFLLILIFTLFACEEIIYEKDISNDSVVIIAPANNANLTNTSVNFSWQAIEGANKYQLQIAEPHFTNATQIVLDTTISNLIFTKELPNIHYQFRVKAQNSAYETAYSTNSFSINTTDNFANNVILLQTPLDNTITNQAEQSLTWMAVNEATDYRIQVWQPDTNGTLVIDEISSSNQKDITFNDGNFIWQVRAQNPTANTQYSQRNILIDTTPPNTPILATPTDNENLTDTNVVFTWQRNALAGSIETDKIYIYDDVNLTNLVHENTVGNNTYSYTLTSGNTYYWNMKTFDEAGNESDVSSTFSFSIN